MNQLIKNDSNESKVISNKDFDSNESTMQRKGKYTCTTTTTTTSTTTTTTTTKTTNSTHY